jgi:DNA-binding transcriptional MerR regulator
MQTPTYLSSAAVAKAAGVGRETLRFYEEKGLVKPLSRTAAGYRQYSPAAVALIGFIKETQHAGFSLKEIQELLRLRITAQSTCSNVSEVLNRKMGSIDDEIANLQRKRAIIHSMVAECCVTEGGKSCGLIP